MKKIIKFGFYIIVSLIAILSMYSLVNAQTPVLCPEGYTCTLIQTQPVGCPAGYTCTVTNVPATVSDSSCYQFSVNLNLGSTGKDVQALQNRLMLKDFLSSAYVSGYFGVETKNAVMDYQKISGLPSTGFFGPLTRAKLNTECLSNPYQSTTTAQSVTISAYIVDAFSDKVGVWKNFSAGPGNVNKNPNDWHFSVVLNSPQSKIVKSISIKSDVYGEGWSTSNDTTLLGRELYPIYVSAKGFENTAHNQTFSIGAGPVYFDLYAQPESTIFSGGTLIVQFTDGTEARATIPASNIRQTSVTSIVPVVPNKEYNFNVTFPTLGAILQVGQTYNIKWTSSEPLNSSYSVYLIGGKLGSTGSTYLGTAYTRGAGDSGVFAWTIPADIMTASNYQIQFSGNGVSGGNSESFSIANSSFQSKSIPSIVAVSGPSHLIAGQKGIWRVVANNTSKYSVIWADGTPISVNEGSGIPRDNEFTSDSTFSHIFTKAGTYYVQFFVKNDDGVVGAQGFKGLNIIVQDIVSVPNVDPTPLVTPTPIQDSVTINLDSANEDRVSGGFGLGAGYLNKNPNDWRFRVTLNTQQAKTIKSISIKSNNYGEGWSTSNDTTLLGRELYPIYVSAKGFESTVYNQTFSIGAGQNFFDLYAQPELNTFSGGTLIISFTDGTQVTATIPASDIKQSVPVTTSNTSSIWNSIKNLFNQ